MTAPLIGMVGYAQAGKDTFAGYLGYHRIAFADKLKQLALDINPIIIPAPIPEWSNEYLSDVIEAGGWEWAKAEVRGVREFLQNLGVAVRKIDPDFWVKAAFLEYTPGVATVFTDVRFPNEIEAIRAAGGIIVRIDRHGNNPVNDHISEYAWQETAPDEQFYFEDGAFHHMRIAAESFAKRLA